MILITILQQLFRYPTFRYNIICKLNTDLKCLQSKTFIGSDRFFFIQQPTPRVKELNYTSKKIIVGKKQFFTSL